ncbi:MAG: hypothetical protein IMY74_08790 [Bacteroidetes bacterium]|nr:hypothetical protein [Bacteroidota bacterium]MCK5765567.1 hypothetical protein [Bacteroidales bacterium]
MDNHQIRIRNFRSGIFSGLIVFFTFICYSQSLFAQNLVYEEKRGDDKIYYHYWFEETPDGHHIKVARVFEGDTTDKHLLVTGPGHRTLSWRYTRSGEHTDIYARLTPDGVHIKGYLDGDEIDELEELDEDEPWIQLFPMNPGMDKFIFSDEDEIVFWSIGTESPADMEINSFSAEKEDSGYHDEFGCEVIRINFSPTGWKSWFWDGDYFFRLDDARVMGYRGDGAPGKPSSKTTLIIEE